MLTCLPLFFLPIFLFKYTKLTKLKSMLLTVVFFSFQVSVKKATTGYIQLSFLLLLVLLLLLFMLVVVLLLLLLLLLLLVVRDRPRQGSYYPLNLLCSPLGPNTTPGTHTGRRRFHHKVISFRLQHIAEAAQARRKGGRGAVPSLHALPLLQEIVAGLGLDGGGVGTLRDCG